MLQITPNIIINETEIGLNFIRSPGPGGQNVNKVASAVQLRFNVIHSMSLPQAVRLRLLAQIGNKLTNEGDLIIKASRFRTQERNKEDALTRLQEIIRRAATPPKKRKKTKPTKASKERRLTQKKQHGKTKALRSRKINNGD